jgi:hypothetical protein
VCVLLHRKRLERAPARQIVKLVKVGQNKNIRIRLGAIKYFITLMTTMEHNKNRKNGGIFTNNLLMLCAQFSGFKCQNDVLLIWSSFYDLKKFPNKFTRAWTSLFSEIKKSLHTSLF